MRQRILAAALSIGLGTLAAPGAALAQPVPSLCHAIAQGLPKARFASFDGRMPAAIPAAARSGEVTITYIHHSTYLIETPEGVRAATDYSGYAGEAMPTIATMNKAHSSHNTPFPDPGIQHVLKGWNPEGGAARHDVTVKDLHVRNVPTDIRGQGGMEPDGNSIFVFETQGLCIGHLGHLHHELTDQDFAAIGRLDIVMVPVDGGMTMSQAGMGTIVERLQSRLVLPMHRFAGPIERFLEKLPGFEVERRAERSLTVSARTLPRRPTVVLLSGV
ncbi:MBL fold metallo-hydrolase [Aurantimonas sp. Leaf443]|uniref:MBL fold metallo-hydrolase n=1 Tax=Aurantimonas sp. Leaf443 TaxID=1736378 RepID=UPI0006FD890F|nr:MBL fold metallo-hydrolase [Aurantimonas sp. Leaf443]KQT88134.1 Zn-dependent hydrolase [Aurantimonas sp. Leaf443]